MINRASIHKAGMLISVLVCGLGAFLAPTASAAQSKITFKLPPARHAENLAVGSDGAIWFDGGSGASRGFEPFIGRLGVGRRLTIISVPKGSAPGAPVAAPDGDAWFPENYRDKQDTNHPRIRLVSPAGPLRSFPLGEEVTSIGSIAALNGDLWFTGTARVNGVFEWTIGRIAASTDGSVQLFPLPTNCASTEIAAATNAVWFTESCSRQTPKRIVYESAAIGRIDSVGGIVRFALPPVDVPTALATGPEDAVWFGAERSQYKQQRIGRITPDGTVSEYRVPNANFDAEIAVGGDERLWFPSSFGGSVTRALGSIGPGGDIGKPICANPKCDLAPVGLTAGPEGTVLFGAQMALAALGGGGSGLIQEEDISEEAGLVGRLTP